MTTPPRRRVMAVDDNRDSLEVVRIALEDDYDVLTLSDPIDTLELVDLFEPDLMILDVMMPKVTGFQLVEVLQNNAQTRELPLVILSAKDSMRDMKHGYSLGASLYLTKPFDPQRLVQSVEAQFRVHPPKPGGKKMQLAELVPELGRRRSFVQGLAKFHTAPVGGARKSGRVRKGML